MSQPKQVATSRPVRATDDEFNAIMTNIRNKMTPLRKVGVKPNWSAVGLALYRAFKAGKIPVEILKGFGEKKGGARG